MEKKMSEGLASNANGNASLQKMAVLSGLNSIRMSARDVLAGADVRYRTEEDEFFGGIENAAAAFAQICAPGDVDGSNRMLREAGFGDIQE